MLAKLLRTDGRERIGQMARQFRPANRPRGCPSKLAVGQLDSVDAHNFLPVKRRFLCECAAMLLYL
jgi:hypothetical protein